MSNSRINQRLSANNAEREEDGVFILLPRPTNEYTPPGIFGKRLLKSEDIGAAPNAERESISRRPAK